MKATVQKEGFDFTSDQVFGAPLSYFSEFKPVFKYKPVLEPDGKCVLGIYYLITDDGYLQVCSYGFSSGKPIIIAQFLYMKKLLVSHIFEILETYFLESRHWEVSLPGEYAGGGIVTKSEFDAFVERLQTRLRSNLSSAYWNVPAMHGLIQSNHLIPEPHGADPFRWVCVCPRCRRKLLSFSRLREHWECTYCNLSGQSQRDLWMAIKSARVRKSQKMEKWLPGKN